MVSKSHNEIGAPDNRIMAEAVLTPWDKDLKPRMWTRADCSPPTLLTHPSIKKTKFSAKKATGRGGLAATALRQRRIKGPTMKQKHPT